MTIDLKTNWKAGAVFRAVRHVSHVGPRAGRCVCRGRGRRPRLPVLHRLPFRDARGPAGPDSPRAGTSSSNGWSRIRECNRSPNPTGRRSSTIWRNTTTPTGRTSRAPEPGPRSSAARTVSGGPRPAPFGRLLQRREAGGDGHLYRPARMSGHQAIGNMPARLSSSMTSAPAPCGVISHEVDLSLPERARRPADPVHGLVNSHPRGEAALAREPLELGIRPEAAMSRCMRHGAVPGRPHEHIRNKSEDPRGRGIDIGCGPAGNRWPGGRKESCPSWKDPWRRPCRKTGRNAAEGR